MTLNMEKLEPLLHMMVQELGAAANAALVLVGDKLGLYRALAEHGPMTAQRPAPTSAMSANGCRRRLPPAISTTTRLPAPSC